MAGVTLRHPSGKFDVTVEAARAYVLRSRGYTDAAEEAISAYADVPPTPVVSGIATQSLAAATPRTTARKGPQGPVAS